MRDLLNVRHVHRYISRRLLLWAIIVMAMLDLGYVANRNRASDHPFIQRAAFSDEYFFDFESLSVHQIALSYERGTWRTKDGQDVHDLTAYYSRHSQQIRQSSIGAYPPVGNIPVFITLVQDSSFARFAEVLRILRASNVCFVAFEEWGRRDEPSIQRGIVGPEVRLVTSLSICDV